MIMLLTPARSRVKRPPHLAAAVIALFFCSQMLTAQTVRTDSLFSLSLGRIKKLSVMLPAGYDRSQQYPLLMLLHGFGGNHRNWSELTKLNEYVREFPLIIVMPDGENSWYVNQKLRPGDRFEDYLMRDVWEYAVNAFSVDTTRAAIAGLSMGGLGALMLGLRHSGRFSFIASLSGALDLPAGIPDLTRHGRDGLRPSLATAFGETPSEYWKEHDLFLLAARLTPERTPHFYLATGIQDDFGARIAFYRAFADTLRGRGLPYEYHETPGRHDWEYWNREIAVVIRRLAEAWRKPGF